MRERIVIIFVSILVSLLAVAGIALYVNNVKRQVADERRMVKVLIAEKDIVPGTIFEDLVKDDLVASKSIPKRYLVDGAVASPSRFKGRVTKVAVAKGEQLTFAKFETSISKAAFTIRLKPDMRAISIPYDEVKCVAGAIRAGDRVDVVITVGKEETGDDSFSKLTLQNIEVLALTDAVDPPRAGQGQQEGAALAADRETQAVKKTITLAVQAGDVEKLVYGELRGRVWLALVPTKNQAAQTSPVIWNTIHDTK